jgi:hypothetical protein
MEVDLADQALLLRGVGDIDVVFETKAFDTVGIRRRRVVLNVTQVLLVCTVGFDIALGAHVGSVGVVAVVDGQ